MLLEAKKHLYAAKIALKFNIKGGHCIKSNSRLLFVLGIVIFHISGSYPKQYASKR